MGLLKSADYTDEINLYSKLRSLHVSAPIAAHVAAAAAAAATDGPSAVVGAAFSAAHAAVRLSQGATASCQGATASEPLPARAPTELPATPAANARAGLLGFVKKHGKMMLVIGLVAFVSYKVRERRSKAISGGQGGL